MGGYGHDNVIDGHAVVAMVGIDTAQMGEDAPMDCDSDYMERDILNEFETVDGMPVYHGDCYHSDWEDPHDLAYADWVDWSDFNALEEYGVDLPDMQDIGLPKAVDATAMMLGEVASPGMSVRNCRAISFRCPGAHCGRARHRFAWIMSGGRMMCHGTSSLQVSRSLSRRGRFGVKFGRILSSPVIRGYLLMCYCSARLIYR